MINETIVVIVPNLKDSVSNNKYEQHIRQEYKGMGKVIVIRENEIVDNSVSINKLIGQNISKIEFRTALSVRKYEVLIHQCGPVISNKNTNRIQKILGGEQ